MNGEQRTKEGVVPVLVLLTQPTSGACEADHTTAAPGGVFAHGECTSEIPSANERIYENKRCESPIYPTHYFSFDFAASLSKRSALNRS